MSNNKLSFQQVFTDALESIEKEFKWDDNYDCVYTKQYCPYVWSLCLQPGQVVKTYDNLKDNWLIFIGTRFGTIAVVPVVHHTGMGGIVCRDISNVVLGQMLPFRPISAKDLSVIVGRDGDISKNIGYAIERMAGTFCEEK